MKKWLIISLSAPALGLLAYNAIRKKAGRVLEEREWYVSQLDYKFSGKIDSVRRIGSQKGFIIFHTNDSIDETLEPFLNRKIKSNGRLRFLVFNPPGKITIFSPAGGKAMAGDSIYVDSAADRLYIFRDGEKVTESVISKYLRGRPF
jgi:hypothetical protein